MTGRHKKIAFFITLGSMLVVAALALNVGWIAIHWRSAVPLVLGVIFFALIIAGLIVYTIFLVREIHRNEQHDSFINAVTHELKTPIASIKLYLETLQSRDVTDEQKRQFYSVMLADTDRLHYTVEQVLKAGLAGQKQNQSPLVSVDMVSIVNECAGLARVRHHMPESALEVTLPPDHVDAPVLGSPDELVTALSNLIDNAVKYSGENVKIKVELNVGAEKIYVYVRDKGVGVPNNQLKLIFDRFYRVQGKTGKTVKGTGLGLYIVRSIAKKHGGKVFAESEGEGKGSTFTLELPRAENLA
ncbi:MAG TPA: HAMP domain-containing sensor histidine kinase [Terriglobales bacterium]|nr:HAMP domain-containing sensor histidine kinase [Terriglobales bacterium]